MTSAGDDGRRITLKMKPSPAVTAAKNP
jgi:hypothetical protein